MPISTETITFVAAMPLEANALRRRVKDMRVIEGGIALDREPIIDVTHPVVVCGIAGGLRSDIPSGTVVIPDKVFAPDGSWINCDAELAARLRSAAERLSVPWTSDPLLTSATMVVGRERLQWAAQGFAAVDMETGLIKAPRLGAIRVIFDTPSREISPDWLHPVRALLKPSNWVQLPMLIKDAPRYCDLAARVAAEAFAGR